MTKTLKNLLTIFAAIAVLGGAYYFFVLFPAETPEVSTGGSGTVAVDTQTIISNINRANSYKIEKDIFSDKKFTSLKNSRADLPSVDTGRPDPFAPTP